MEFEDQITNVRLVIDTTPRVYVKWNNTQDGMDKHDCYERVVIGETVIYINTYNRSSSVIRGHPFWDKLEKMYNGALRWQSIPEVNGCR